MRRKTHGLSGTRLYGIWASMKYRCTSTSSSSYALYGARGIAVCDEWLDFLTFYEWANSNGYRDDLSLDRVDNDGDYCPSNCRWVDANAQANNRRNNVRYEYQGRRLTIAELSEMSGIRKHVIRKRLSDGQSVEEALSKPDVRKNGGLSVMVDTKKIKMRLIEKDMSVGDLADMMRRSYANVSSKINNKTPMTLDDAVRMQRILDIPDSRFCEFFLAGGRDS